MRSRVGLLIILCAFKRFDGSMIQSYENNNRVVEARQTTMVTVPPAAEMAQVLSSSGKIALYGVYFDSNKTEVKPSSEETLGQVGKLLQDHPSLKLLVVGHTDNAGGFPSNMDLSKKRAAAVVDALVGRFGVERDRLTPVGVSFAAPIGSNMTEDGRARNRRVELVENYTGTR